MTTATPQECVGKQGSTETGVLRQTGVLRHPEASASANIAKAEASDAHSTRRVKWKDPEPRRKLTLREAMALSRQIKRERRRGSTQGPIAVAE
eukprot:scaffold15056_cov51-Cyclotella_meneghiniana.AAC.1